MITTSIFPYFAVCCCSSHNLSCCALASAEVAVMHWTLGMIISHNFVLFWNLWHPVAETVYLIMIRNEHALVAWSGCVW